MAHFTYLITYLQITQSSGPHPIILLWGSSCYRFLIDGYGLGTYIKISISMYILIFGFYGYIGDISMNIFI